VCLLLPSSLFSSICFSVINFFYTAKCGPCRPLNFCIFTAVHVNTIMEIHITNFSLSKNRSIIERIWLVWRPKNRISSFLERFHVLSIHPQWPATPNELQELKRTCQRTVYMMESHVLYLDTFKFLHAISQDQLTSIIKWNKEIDLCQKMKDRLEEIIGDLHTALKTFKEQ